VIHQPRRIVRRGFHLSAQEISAMKTYIVTLRAPTRWTEQTIRARTPQAALTKARKAVDADPFSFDWEPYEHDSIEMLEEVVVCDSEGTELATWLSDDCRQSLAAGDLLAACEMAVERLRLNDCEGEEGKFIAVLESAIAKAKGGAA
jgi:hypothetical protein